MMINLTMNFFENAKSNMITLLTVTSKERV